MDRSLTNELIEIAEAKTTRETTPPIKKKVITTDSALFTFNFLLTKLGSGLIE